MSCAQQHGIRIQSFEDFVSFLIVMGDCDSLWRAVDKSALKVILPISLHGKGCDGRVDLWGAEFFRSLQKELNWVLKEFGNTSFRARGNMLRTQVSEGSDKSETDYTGVIKAMLKKMDGKQVTTCVLTGILLGTGYWAFNSWNERVVEQMRIECRQAAQTELLRHDERLVEQLAKSNAQLIREFKSSLEEQAAIVENMGRDPEKPIRKYAKSMRRRDLLSVGGGESHAKAQTLEKLRARPDETLFWVMGDGRYVLHGVELVGRMQAIRIDQGEYSVAALLERLDKKIKDAILATVDSSMEAQSGKEIDLQIDVYFTPNAGVKHAVVVGVGTPRKGNCYGLAAIPRGVPSQEWRSQGEE